MTPPIVGLDAPRPGQRRICPAVTVLLDDDVEGLGTDLVMNMARWHPDALAFATAVRMTGSEGEDRRRRLLRVAIDAVTDVVARRQALQRGYFIEDTVWVFMVFSAGGALPDGALSTVLQTVHRVASEMYDQTQLEVHALVFLPDLADPWERELRYDKAYRRLLEVDGAGSTGHALAHRPHSSFDQRWFVDSRTRSGAYAGGLAEVRSPVAEFLAALLDGREEGPSVAARRAREQVRAQVRDRHSAYSTFGVAVLFHDPDMLLRTLICYAGERYLSGYLGRSAAPGSYDPDPLPASAPAPGLDFGQLLRDWSAEVRRQLDRLVQPDLQGADRLAAEDRTRQTQHRTGLLEGLDGWMERGIREVLAAGGIPLARRLLDALRRTTPADDPLQAAAATVGELRLDALRHVREFLRLDVVTARENEARARQERLDAAGPGSGLAERDEAERDLHKFTAMRRRLETYLDTEVEPDRLEAQLLAEVPEIEQLAPPPVPQTPPRSASGTEPSRDDPPRGRPAAGPAEKPGLFARLWKWLKELGGPPLAAQPARGRFWRPRAGDGRGGAERLGGGRTGPGKEDGAQPVPARAAWQVAERVRFVNAYAGLLGRLEWALREHEADVASAARYYHAERRALQRWLTEGTRFYVPVLSPGDFRRYAERYVDRIQSRLASGWDRRQLARCFRLGPVPLTPYDTRLLVRLPGLEEALDVAGDAVGAPLRQESLVAVLRERSHAERGQLLLNTLGALSDSSEPLARPRATGREQLSTTRWLYGHPELYALFRADPESAHLLDEREVVHVDDGDPNNLMLCSSLHSFAAYELRKMLTLRARMHAADGSLPREADDLVPLDLGRAWEGSDIFELAVLAKVLGVLGPRLDAETGEERLVFEEFELPKDLLLITDELAFSLKSRNAEERLQRAVDAALGQPGCIEALRAASERSELSTAERNVLREVLTEFQTRSSIAWSLPIIGEETHT